MVALIIEESAISGPKFLPKVDVGVKVRTAVLMLLLRYHQPNGFSEPHQVVGKLLL